MSYWCVHINSDLELGSQSTVFGNWMFCPICGTPRPKEISLEEKFRAWMQSDAWRVLDAPHALAKIAEEHFKKSSH